MGEISKTSGENGEKITEELLRLIGWSDPVKGVSIDCNVSSHKKRTHGNDFVYIYNNPLHDSRTDIVYISSKNNKDGYPSTADGIKTKFKQHLHELDQIVSCSKYDNKISQLVKAFESRKHKRHIGLLVWTHGNLAALDRDIKSDLSNIQLSLESNSPLYLIDMSRISFIQKSLEHFKITNPGEECQFYYPKLGKVILDEDERFGKLLPIELLVSDIIPIRFMKGKKPALCLYAKQDFSVESLAKLCSLALDFAGGWVQDISIGLQSYHSANDRHEKDSVLMSYQKREANIEVFCYKSSPLGFLD